MASESSIFKQEVALLVDELFASANAHDTDRHLAVYVRDPSLIFIINGEAIRGWDAYREKQRQWWDDGRAVGLYRRLDEPIYEYLGDGYGMTTLFMVGQAQRPDRTIRERQMVFTALWRKGPEGWRIVYAHESSTR